jgi:hypothetical protein
MIWLLIGFTTYIATAALGTSAQLGLVNTRPFRWAHHALFAAVWLTLILLVVMAWGAVWLVAVVPIAVSMATLPRFRAGTRPHCTCALIGLASYGVMFVWAATVR